METNMQLDIYLIIVALFTSSGLEHTHTPRVLDSELLKLFQQLLISLSEKWGDLVQCTKSS